MTGLLRGAAVLAGMALVVGCESATDVEVADLRGTWTGTEVRFVDLEIPKENNVDLIEIGYTAVFSSDGSGAFTLRLTDPEGEHTYVSGTLETEGTRVTVTTGTSTDRGDVFLEDEQVALYLTSGLTFDFKGDGEERPARLILVMDRGSPEPTPL